MMLHVNDRDYPAMGECAMRKLAPILWLAAGVGFGVLMMMPFIASRPVLAGNDRYEDYIMCTGQIAMGVNIQADCIWLLDYRGGKLLGTIVDKNLGKVMPWSRRSACARNANSVPS